MMLGRLIQRFIATYRIYSFIPALLSVPRSLYGNLLNLHAVIRAYHLYFTAEKSKKAEAQPLPWDKTEHAFPGRHLLVPYKRRLGDLLLEKNKLTQDQLTIALIEQQRTGERLGNILIRLNLINRAELTNLLASQYNLELFPTNQITSAKQFCLPKLSRKTKKWLIKHEVHPVKISSEAKTITLAISDPTNQLLLNEIVKQVAPHQAEFMLINDTEVSETS